MTNTAPKKQFILKIDCPAVSGIVASVSTFLYEQGCYLQEVHQFDDQDTERLFMRIVGLVPDSPNVLDTLRTGFAPVADKFSMDWRLYDTAIAPKVLIMVSKFDHCLNDLLYRLRKGDLHMDVVAVVSNHQDLRPMVEREGIRFIHLPITPENKPTQEQALLDIIDDTNAELVVLARYMQILSDGLSQKLRGNVINIHHSFLPSFKGAKPYHQAFDRGVKLIGATAHYVTADLDEGPIIAQSVQTVDHTYQPNDLVRVGRNTETQALGTAVQYHLERRVFLDGNKTIVLK